MSNREEFEAIPEIKDLIERGVVFFNKHKEKYDGLRGDYARGAWLAWQARVPEGYTVVPKESSPVKSTGIDYSYMEENYKAK